MNIFGNKGEGKMKKTEGYIVKELEDEYIVKQQDLFISMQIRQKILKDWRRWLETNMG